MAAKKKAAAAKPAAKKKGSRTKSSKSSLMYFMGALIQAGHLEEIPEEAGEQHKQAQRLRQMAQKLEMQVRRAGEGAELTGGEGAGEEEEDE